MEQQKNIKAGIVGGAGYTGGELLRILLRHPQVDVVFVHSRSQAGLPVAAVHTDLLGDTALTFTDTLSQDADVLFLCVGHGEAKQFLEQHTIPESVRIIDLSQDFRLEGTVAGGRSFVYGLPECNRVQVRTAANIANPGCFATAIQLALLPLAAEQLLNSEVHATGITGSTGAGQKLQESSHFSWRSGNIQAYKSLSHQHLHEIRQTLRGLQPGVAPVNFIPWRGDFTRGIYVTAYTDAALSIEAAIGLYVDYYEQHPFTHVSNRMIDLKQVVNTNKCVLHLEQADGRLIIHAAIDNLLKGASGQAVQNMNLMFGLPETAGLQLKATSF